MGILLDPGQRGIIIGQTGSGKTLGAIWHMQQAPFDNVIVLDTKGEPNFNKLARDDETINFYNSAAAFSSALKKPLANFSIVRPEPNELIDLDYLDSVLMDIYNRGRECLVYVDEAYQWHINGRAGAGLTGLLTRGRSKGISTLLSTQRPAWISRFCFSESQKFYVYKLSDKRDVKTVSEHIPELFSYFVVKPYHFWFYDNASDMDQAGFFKPVPMPDLKNLAVDDVGRKWL